MNIWKSGRQGGGYGKIKIFVSRRYLFDMYFLRIPKGTDIKPHRDPVPTGEHHRINIRLWGDAIHRFEHRDSHAFTRFRPDIELHWVPVVGRTSYFLSIGWLK
jgi:hypothetical protein